MGYGYGYTTLYKKHRNNLKNFPVTRFNTKYYFRLSLKIVKLPAILFANNSYLRWKIFLDMLKDASYLAGKIVSSYKNRILYL